MGDILCCNPCFVGFPTQTRQRVGHNGLRRECFNPCFVGFPTQTISRMALPAPLSIVSILVLLDSLLRRSERTSPRYGLPCFNPCFVGFPTQTEWLETPTGHLDMFQSLFCWIPYSDSDVRTWLRDRHGRFQSLFCWIPYSDAAYHRPAGRYDVVSILVLLDSLLRPVESTMYHPSASVGFNPCFVGFPTQT